MKRSLTAAILAFAAIAPCGAWAQQAPAPGPVLQVTIDPPRVVVGQRTALRIDVLAPNYMTSPPELPGFQVRNAVTRQLQSVNLSEQRNGASYAGVRFEFAIYPQEAGSFAISDQKVKVKYAAEPPAVREELLSLPRVSFEAFIPDAAADLNPFLAASRLHSRIWRDLHRHCVEMRGLDAPFARVPPAHVNRRQHIVAGPLQNVGRRIRPRCRQSVGSPFGLVLQRGLRRIDGQPLHRRECHRRQQHRRRFLRLDCHGAGDGIPHLELV